MKDFDISDFKGLKNLESLTTFAWSMNVDIIFNEHISKENFPAVIKFLEKPPCIKSIGYKGKDFIRVQFAGKFFDDIISKTNF